MIKLTALTANHAHHAVVAKRVDSEGVTVRGTEDVFSVYCTLDAMGCRTVAKAVSARFGVDRAVRVRVEVSCGSFVAEVAS